MTKNFNVLFVADTSSNDDCSAVQRLRVLKMGLEKFGVQTELLYLGNYRISHPRVFLPINTPLFLKKLRSYHFVHAAGLSSYVMGLAKPLANFKLVSDIHGSIEESRMLKTSAFDFSGNYHVLASIIGTYLARKKADYFVTVSEPLRQQLLRDGIEEDRTEVLYNGVDTQLFRPSEERNSVFTATYAGAYQKWQGIENLVRAAELLRNENVQFKFLGFKRSNLGLKNAIKARLKEKAELIDFQPRIANAQPLSLVHELGHSDVLVIPRYWDSGQPIYSDPAYVKKAFGWLPTKFAEYIATGRPVIVTNLDAVAEFVEKYDCGFVCDADPESIAKAIMKAKEMSPEKLDKKGMNGRRLAETEFDLQVISKKYFEVLSKIA